ncbi:MAG: starch-binding protein [Bacteroidales bacterium]|nr:starch-binding protein [Bacteroidales bacterium]
MKKILKYLALPAIALAAASCLQDPLEFDHEKQAFETRSDQILLEVIMPQATLADDEIYIVGEFNGGEAAVGNGAYRMIHSETITSKWGVYLNPSAFQGGKTLADGFTFYSVQQGYERSPRGEEVKHTLNLSAGQWANVYVDKWAKYFEPAPEPGGFEFPEHAGTYRIYVVDKTGWDEIALYMWGDVNNLGGGWPGIQPGGTLDAEGTKLTYFDIAEEEAAGLNENLIFNNNNNGTQLDDYNMTFGEDKDIFLEVTADGVTPLSKEDIAGGGGGIVIPAHDGVRVWIIDNTGWDAIALYMWGDVNNFGGDWPGMQVAGTATIGGVEYKYFEYGEDIYGLAENLIFNNNNNGTQLDDVNVAFEEGVQDYFFEVTADGATLLEGPGGGSGTPQNPDDPEPPVEQKNDPVTIYVQDLTGWAALNLYMWGDKELCGGWPGLAVSDKTVKIGTVVYKTFVIEDALGRSENLIFNNGDGLQTPDFASVLPAELYLCIGEDLSVTEVDPSAADIKILVNNQTNWAEIALYAWGDAEAFGGWPGATPIGKETVGDVEYTVFGLTADMAGKTLNLIFNNNGGGKQLADFAITVPEDELFLNINAQYSVGAVEGNPRGGDKKRVAVFVDDQTGWDAIALYMWGDVNNLGGGWPGIQVGANVTIGETAWKVFFIEDALGLSENLIFNNNGNNVQLGDYGLRFEKNEYFFTVTAEGATLVENPSSVVVFAEDKTGWDEIALYMWGDVNNLGGGWPGVAVSGEGNVSGTDVKVFVIDDALGLSENLIFNNNGNNVQLGDYALKFERNAYYLTVTSSGVSVF